MVAIERQEQALIPTEAEPWMTVRPRADLGINFNEPAGVSLLDANYFVYRTTETDHERFDVIIDHPPFRSSELVAVLDEVAPNKKLFASAYGIEADWYILDPPEGRRDSVFINGSQNAQLVEMHEKLGESWKEFGRSQPAFISTLRDALYTYYRDFRREGNISADQLIDNARITTILEKYLQMGIRSLDVFADRLEIAGVPGAAQFVLNAVAKSSITHNRKTRPISATPQNEAELRRRYNAASSSRRYDLLSRIINYRLTEEQSTSLLASLRSDYDWAEVNGVPWAYLKDELAEGVTLAGSVANRRQAAIGSFFIDVVDIPKKDGSVAVVHVPDSARKFCTRTTISPHIAWIRDSEGRRSFVFERYSQESEGKTNYVDGVLGALVLAYIQPEVRKDWPESMRIEKKSQEMGAAQVPVLALMKSRSILSGAFVEFAEIS